MKTKRSEVIIRAHLEGKLKVLKPITGEGVYNKLAADIRTVCINEISTGFEEDLFHFVCVCVWYFIEKA